MDVSSYDEEHGEPGGLTLATGPGTVNYDTNRDGSSRLFDRFEMERDSVNLALEHDVSDDTMIELTSWYTYYSRYSQRQRGGGFGTLP